MGGEGRGWGAEGRGRACLRVWWERGSRCDKVSRAECGGLGVEEAGCNLIDTKHTLITGDKVDVARACWFWSQHTAVASVAKACRLVAPSSHELPPLVAIP